MKLKRILFTVVFAIMLSIPGYSSDVARKAKTDSVKTETTETPGEIRSKELMRRLEEIQNMDVKSMTRKEKRALREEVKSIKKEVKELRSNGGVYISVGALLIIFLLLIILL